MTAEILWYKTAPSKRIRMAAAAALAPLSISLAGEQNTVKAELVPPLLSQSLSRAQIVVICGGMNAIKRDENIVYVLSRCLSQPIEENGLSRSSYIYDTLRGLTLPSFTSGYLFPSIKNEPEGVVLTADEQCIILLPSTPEAACSVTPVIGEFLAGITGTPVNEPPKPERRSVSQRLSEIEERRAERERATAPVEVRLMEKEARELLRPVAMEYMRPAEESNLAHAEEIQRKRSGKGSGGGRNKRKSFVSLTAARIMALGLIAAFIVMTCVIAYDYYEPVEVAPAYYQEVAELYGDESSEEFLPQDALVKFARLYSENSDVRGFITIPGTGISLPVLQPTLEEGIGYYETHDYYGNEDSRGSLFFTVENDITRNGENTNLVVFGDSPADGTLFADLSKYTQRSFFAKNPLITMDTLYESLQWRVFSVCIVSSDTISEFNYANTSFIGKYAMEKHLYELFIRSLFLTDCDVFPTDRLLTLVTPCNEFEGAKLLVVARPLREDEDISDAGDGVIDNPNVLMPQIWYDMKGKEMPDIPELELDEDYSEEDERQSTTSDQGMVIFNTSKQTTTTAASKTTVTTEKSTDKTTEKATGTKKTTTEKTTKKTTGKSTKKTTKKTTEKTTTKKKTTTSVTTTASTTSSYVSGADISTSESTQTTTSKTTTSATNPTTAPPSKNVPKTMRIKSGGKVIEKSTATVLAMIVEAEMSSANPIEALKAQAVAAYTFYKYSGGAAKAPSFPTKSKPGARVKQAVAEVLGQYMTVGGKVKYCPYYAISAGKTASNETVNGTKLSHLVSVDCPSDKSDKGYKVVKTMSASKVASKVKSSKGINLYNISDKKKWIQVLSRDSNGLYVTKVKVGSKTYRGSTLYLTILGSSALRSPCFDVSYSKSSDSFTFTSYGYGHGVGMSQRGANAYAKQGKNYVWILQHFYKGCKIVG